MLQLVKKSAFMSLGLAVLSASAIKRIAEKISEESKLSESEGRKLVEDMLAESEKSKGILKKKVEDSVKESISEMDIATSADVASINLRLDMIENDLRKDTASPAVSEPIAKEKKKA
jgi:polyhydroxyalkanoate synthesis regulator phasin